MNDIMNRMNQLTVQPMVETASTAAAAQAKAMVEARYTIAMHRPRNWDQVRQDVIKECRRPSFANNKSAFYRKPIGKTHLEGLGIRFVEVAMRCMTNILTETMMVYEDETKEIHRVSVTDLETNTTYHVDVKVNKTVERSRPASDGSFISVRKNSYGNDVYLIEATEDDMLNKRGAQISKAIRTLGQRIIPGDLQDEAIEIIKATRLNEAARDPDAESKRIVDAFASINVKAVQLAEYLGHPIDQCSPSELVDLRGIFGAIKDGETSWKAVIENRRENEEQEEPKHKKSVSDVIKPPPSHEGEGKKMNASQRRMIRAALHEYQKNEEQLLDKFACSVDELMHDMFNTVMEWIKE